MNFSFSEEEEAFRSTIREWVEAKCPKDVALELEREEDHDGTHFPQKLWDDMAEAGFFGIGIDEEFGGQGGNCVIQCIFMEEVARSIAGIAWIWGINQFNTKSIQKFASDEIKSNMIPRLTEGKVKTAIAVTEPGCGTDLLGGMITTATPDGDGWRINGAKIWSTMAHVSDYLLLLATSDPNAEKASRGKTLFLVDAKQEGVVSRPIPKLGMRCVGSCEVQLDNAYVPSTHVIGEVNKGWGHILSTLNNERILVAAMCTGILRGVIEEAIKYANERVAFGKRISEFQVINHWIADMQMRLMQAELVTYKSAWLFDNDLPCGVESSAAKAICSEYATDAADRGIQILGGMGYSAEYQMQRYWRDVRLYQIGPVTNQMVRNIVAESVGLPRAF
ncbi:MAG: acyl-CoA dehydrogenase [Actinobacteria bacterium]|nr:acyl-CoA dehydrogenase [Actinomycetota bacterium]